MLNIIEKNSIPFHIREGGNPDIKIYNGQFGGKSIKVSINMLSGSAETRIDNDGASKVKGATTQLYQQAKHIMEHAASDFGTPLKYTFRTYSPVMEKWALSEGERIFHWNDHYHAIDDDEFFANAFISRTK